MQSLVLGATGIVGGFIKQKLVQSGERPFALSRHLQKDTNDIIWFRGDLTKPRDIRVPASDVLYSTVHPLMLAPALEFVRNTETQASDLLHIDKHRYKAQFRN